MKLSQLVRDRQQIQKEVVHYAKRSWIPCNFFKQSGSGVLARGLVPSQFSEVIYGHSLERREGVKHAGCEEEPCSGDSTASTTAQRLNGAWRFLGITRNRVWPEFGCRM